MTNRTNGGNYFNGKDVDKLTGRIEFEYKKLAEMEKSIVGVVNSKSVVTESMFARQALPILSGMLDDTFRHEAWEDYVGSQLVALQVVSDEDHQKLLFEIPPLLNSGRTLLPVPGQPTLTDETEDIRIHGEIITEVGERAMADMINGTLDGIDRLSYADNIRHAVYVIKLMNWIFDRYKINGSLPYPEGLLEAYNEIEKVSPKDQVKKPEPSETKANVFGDDY